MRKVAVIGAGKIGSTVVDLLVGSGSYEVLVLDQSAPATTDLGHVGESCRVHELGNVHLFLGDAVDIEFFEPAEAAALMRCTESWLRDGATSGKFPHACWGKGKIIFTSEHIREIARLSEILPGGAESKQSTEQPLTKQRLIGTRSKARLATVN